MKVIESMFDGWTNQNRGSSYGPGGSTDAWGFLMKKYHGQEGPVGVAKVAKMITPLIEFACSTWQDIDRNVMFESNGVTYGPETFPVNVIVWLNDLNRWTPDDFRTLDLMYQFSVEDVPLTWFRMDAQLTEDSEAMEDDES